jgi:hypothetical protein
LPPGFAGGLADLITGDDQDFGASLGAWTNSGGTLTRDTGYQIDGLVASLKFAATATNQRIELPIDGTFLADTDYWLVVWLSNESTSSTFAMDVSFGLFGTDVTTETITLNMASGMPYVGDGNFTAVGIHWRPTADRTGVTFRGNTSSGTTTTWHVGMIRAWQTPLIGPIKAGSSDYAYVPGTVFAAVNIGPSAESETGLLVRVEGRVELNTAGKHSRLILGSDNSATPDAFAFILAEHPAADLAGTGLNIEVGEDGVGFYVSEKDSSTIQFYDDSGGSYDLEFVDQSTFHWRSKDAAGVIRNFASMENRVNAGTATITTGNTSISVTHGAGYTPSVNDIVITPTNSPTNDPGNFWISNVGATTFDINVRANPGASGASFAWRVDR